MIERIKEIYAYREMIVSLVKRDLKGRYKGSALGFLWTFLNPLFQLIVYTMVFSTIMRAGIKDYYLFLFVALIPWIFFSTSLAGGASCIMAQQDMVKKIYFPREVLPISYVTSQFINMLLSFIVIFIVLIAARYPLKPTALLCLPIVMIVEYVLALGLTMIMCSLTVYLRDLEYVLGSLKLLGSKGTTGTQASFLELFDGDQETIDKIDPMIAEKMGFKSCYPVSGQTYSRKVDTRVLNILAGIAASAHKMSNDIRLLQHLKEVEEPFEKSQIGSSAMAYKRNPMRSERIASLSRYVMIDALNPAITSATQWFERTLDDSANKRLSVPEGFLAIDGILDLCLNVVDGLVVYPKVIYKHFMAEIPFMATENIMMDAVKNGGNRQEMHEKIRQLSMEAGKNVKEEGKDNNLLELIAADPAFNLTLEELEKSMDPAKYVGRAPIQVTAFLENVIKPALEERKDLLGVEVEINV